jgi:hypothetical protein
VPFLVAEVRAVLLDVRPSAVSFLLVEWRTLIPHVAEVRAPKKVEHCRTNISVDTDVGEDLANSVGNGFGRATRNINISVINVEYRCCKLAFDGSGILFMHKFKVLQYGRVKERLLGRTY